MSRNAKVAGTMYKVCFCWILVGLAVHCGVAYAQEERRPIGLSVGKDIRVVYQIKDDDWKGGIGRGLHYVQKLVGAYNSLGVAEGDRSIHAVFHGSAGYWMLKDKPYREHKATTTGNPNKQVIEELAKSGVSIELCAQTMKNHGWTAGDILPEVKIVVGAYPRIIDLQMQGYAYIRF